jgi:hypothetical protein
VLGATQWKAPNWMGLPVQWCGLVYADALYRFARYDPNGPWKRIADGITASGIQQSFEREDPDLTGLLPDSYGLRTMTRNPVAINPGTVQANAVQLFTGRPLYEMRVFRGSGAIVHAPGPIEVRADGKAETRFQVEPWASGPCYLLLSRAQGKPRTVRFNGALAETSGQSEYHDKEQALVLRIQGRTEVEIAW